MSVSLFLSLLYIFQLVISGGQLLRSLVLLFNILKIVCLLAVRKEVIGRDSTINNILYTGTLYFCSAQIVCWLLIIPYIIARSPFLYILGTKVL